MALYTALIMGANFRPPAKAIIESLRAGVELQLVREPTNEYDTNAVQIWTKPQSVHQEDRAGLEVALSGYGKSLEDFDEAPEWWLGYVAKAVAASVSPMLKDGASLKATLSFSGAGKAQVEIDYRAEGEPLEEETDEESENDED